MVRLSQCRRPMARPSLGKRRSGSTGTKRGRSTGRAAETGRDLRGREPARKAGETVHLGSQLVGVGTS